MDLSSIKAMISGVSDVTTYQKSDINGQSLTEVNNDQFRQYREVEFQTMGLRPETLGPFRIYDVNHIPPIGTVGELTLRVVRRKRYTEQDRYYMSVELVDFVQPS